MVPGPIARSLIVAFGIILSNLFSITSALADKEGAFSATIDFFVFDVAIPTYKKLSESAEKLDITVGDLCKRPAPEAYNTVNEAFREVVRAWSSAEVIRFGPIRQENRLERIFYWPDTRSRGLKKTRTVLAEGQISADTDLKGKTVAIQGLPALEYLLYGARSVRLKKLGGDPARCAFAKAISNNLRGISQELLAAWESPEKFQKTIGTPGTDNPRFRSNKEAIQEILKSAAELTELVSVAKLESPLGKTVEKSKPKRAAFWRSGLTLENIDWNVRAIVNLQETARLSELLPAEERGYGHNLIFEARQVNKALKTLTDSKKLWPDLVGGPQSRTLLLYVLNPLTGMKDILSVYYPEALGLQLGFNSLDGD